MRNQPSVVKKMGFQPPKTATLNKPYQATDYFTVKQEACNNLSSKNTSNHHFGKQNKNLEQNKATKIPICIHQPNTFYSKTTKRLETRASKYCSSSI
jgi:hypothetical protein